MRDQKYPNDPNQYQNLLMDSDSIRLPKFDLMTSLWHTGLIPQWVQDEPGGPRYDMRDFKWRRYNCYFEDGFETQLSDD